jgi:hypothetical protein
MLQVQQYKSIEDFENDLFILCHDRWLNFPYWKDIDLIPIFELHPLIYLHKNPAQIDEEDYTDVEEKVANILETEPKKVKQYFWLTEMLLFLGDLMVKWKLFGWEDFVHRNFSDEMMWNTILTDIPLLDENAIMLEILWLS